VAEHDEAQPNHYGGGTERFIIEGSNKREHFAREASIRRDEHEPEPVVYGANFCKSVLDRNGDAVEALVSELEKNARGFRDQIRCSDGDRVHSRHHVLATRRLSQRSARAVGILRLRHVNNFLHYRRRASRVPPRTLHLHEGNRLQRLSQVVVFGLARAGCVAGASVPLAGFRGNNFLGRGPGRRSFGLFVLFPDHFCFLLGREFLRDVPFRCGASRDAGLHHRGGHSRVLLALQWVLHQQG